MSSVTPRPLNGFRPGRPALRAHFFGDGCRRKNREVPAPLILPDKARWGEVGGLGEGNTSRASGGVPLPQFFPTFLP